MHMNMSDILEHLIRRSCNKASYYRWLYEGNPLVRIDNALYNVLYGLLGTPTLVTPVLKNHLKVIFGEGWTMDNQTNILTNTKGYTKEV